jgi:hypothetical protein
MIMDATAVAKVTSYVFMPTREAHDSAGSLKYKALKDLLSEKAR